ncbi:MAG: SRPBCC domain-containing protein [Polyangiaceae bacterium]|nr:SRPBCC domain-containing protein [Polyangiaceae bacterium]
MEALVARASVVIAASRAVVWGVLMSPETIPLIMPVTAVIAPWQPGQRFVWAFKLGPRESRVEGVVHRVEDERLLEYEYQDPHSRDVLGIQNAHRVTLELFDDGDGTRLDVVQDANVSKAAQAHAEGGWRLALNNLKGLVEQSRS